MQVLLPKYPEILSVDPIGVTILAAVSAILFVVSSTLILIHTNRKPRNPSPMHPLLDPNWPLHEKVAEYFYGVLRPFDHYVGPRIQIPWPVGKTAVLSVHRDPDDPDGRFRIHRLDTNRISSPILPDLPNTVQIAIVETRKLLEGQGIPLEQFHRGQSEEQENDTSPNNPRTETERALQRIENQAAELRHRLQDPRPLSDEEDQKLQQILTLHTPENSGKNNGPYTPEQVSEWIRNETGDPLLTQHLADSLSESLNQVQSSLDARRANAARREAASHLLPRTEEGETSPLLAWLTTQVLHSGSVLFQWMGDGKLGVLTDLNDDRTLLGTGPTATEALEQCLKRALPDVPPSTAGETSWPH